MGTTMAGDDGDEIDDGGGGRRFNEWMNGQVRVGFYLGSIRFEIQLGFLSVLIRLVFVYGAFGGSCRR